MKPVIFFRQKKELQSEIEAAKRYFEVYHSRVLIPENSLVIARYSALPYYTELEADLDLLKSRLINSYYQHSYIADFSYYWDIEPYTFKTWFRLQDIPLTFHDKPLIVKGRTNSRKNQWNTRMFARNFREAVNIGAELMNDPDIAQQDILVREYVPLETFETGINDMPITNEWRIFFYQGKVVDYGYYWSAIIDNLDIAHRAKPDFIENALPVAQKVAEIVAEFADFYVIDMAKTQRGEWKVVEINDGQQSGLNEAIKPEEFYKKLFQTINQKTSMCTDCTI